MKQCERCKMKFKDVLQYIEHKNTFKHTWKPMDPAEKDRVVARVEANLMPYLLGHGVIEKVTPKRRPIEIIIERTPESVRNVKPIVEGFLPDPFRLEPEWVG